MHVFSIKDIENLTGIKAHTLRIWEQRYAFFKSQRKASRHRFYDNEDLKNILRIAYLYKNGLKISRIACLGQEEIRQHALMVIKEGDNKEILINLLIEAAIDFDQASFEKILGQQVKHLGVENAVLQLVFPLLNSLGLLWLADKLRPAQEHFASALIIKHLLLSTNELSRRPDVSKRFVLLFTPPGELHEIPVLFMQYLLKRNGIGYLFAGKDVSFDTLSRWCSVNRITELYLHLITNLLHCDINSYLDQLHQLFPDKKIFFSGSILIIEQVRNPNVTILKGKDEMLEFASNKSI